MRRWTVLIVLIFTISSGALANTAPIDLVFDIDWTSFYSVEASQQDDKTIPLQDKLYRPTDHFTEVVALLLSSHPEVRISFFSGGERSRNEALLKSVFLPNGKSLFESAYMIFSKEHLTVLSTDPALKFSVRHKKVLEGHLPNWNPARTILIDDQVEFAKPPLKAVASFGVFNFQKQFDPSKSTEAFFPPSENDWRWERDKALLWLAMIETALTDSQRENITFAEAAERVWKAHSRDELFRQKGRRLLKRAQQGVHGLSCRKIFAF